MNLINWLQKLWTNKSNIGIWGVLGGIGSLMELIINNLAHNLIFINTA